MKIPIFCFTKDGRSDLEKTFGSLQKSEIPENVEVVVIDKSRGKKIQEFLRDLSIVNVFDHIALVPTHEILETKLKEYEITPFFVIANPNAHYRKTWYSDVASFLSEDIDMVKSDGALFILKEFYKKELIGQDLSLFEEIGKKNRFIDAQALPKTVEVIQSPPKVKQFLPLELPKGKPSYKLHIEATGRPNVNTPQYWNTRLKKGSWAGREKAYDLVIPFLSEKGSLLDIGCAAGDGLQAIARKFQEMDIFGLDLSNAGISSAKLKFPKQKFFQGDARIDHKVFLKNYTYSIIVQSLQHIDMPGSLVERLLKISKKVIITVPNGRAIEDKEHLWRFNALSFDNFPLLHKKVTPSHLIFVLHGRD